MLNILGDLVGRTCLVYIDDVVCWGNSAEECLANVREVMIRLASKGVMCNEQKCCFLATEIELLGHTISQGKIKPQTWKLEPLKGVLPKTVKDV